MGLEGDKNNLNYGGINSDFDNFLVFEKSILLELFNLKIDINSAIESMKSKGLNFFEIEIFNTLSRVDNRLDATIKEEVQKK